MRRRTAETAAEQARVIAALLASGDTAAAERLQRCMVSMTHRRHGGGHPWTCRGAGCAWCRQALGRRWWRGIAHWLADGGAPMSLDVLSLPHAPGDLRSAARRLRRACRDVRDRAARRWRPWRSVAIGGMAAGGDRAFLLIRHPRIDREEVADVLAARWPDALVGDVAAVEPPWSMATEDAAELASIRRGVEPLRIVVLPQRAAVSAGAIHRSAGIGTTPPLAPMPIVF